MTKKLFSAMLLTVLVIAASMSAFHEQLNLSSGLQGGSLSLSEQQVVALVNGSRAYDYDLELESIAYKYPAFRAAGSTGANDTANWIKEQFESFGLNASLEPFQFTNWTLLSVPSLVIDEDGSQSTTSDQIVINSFQCEHYSWPTLDGGVFADLVILPLPSAAGRSEIGTNPINMTEWDAIDTTGRIVLIGREIRWDYTWQDIFVDKLTAQPPAAVVHTWWYSWMSFTPPLHSSTGGRPLGGIGPYYWDLGIPVGFLNYDDGLWIRNKEKAVDVSANVSIRAVIDSGTHYNVVGKITGYKNPENLVIISGHYDTVMCSGFCDNGAGVAGVVELAEVFAEAAEKEVYQPSYTLLFVAFTGEELDLVGAINYIREHKGEMTNITAVINLDCIGSDNLYVTETDPANGFDLDEVIVDVANDLSVNITLEPPGGSDQEAFRIPADVNNWYFWDWGLEANISDATPVESSAMLDSYPLFFSDLWSRGVPGWIHTSYDNSTSTDTLNWIEVGDLENHIKVSALSIMRVSPNAIIPPPPPSRLIIVPDNYTTIQQAVNNANDNDTIFVRNGTYSEHVVVDKKVSLIGENRGATIIDGNGNGTVVLLSATSNVTGFTIRKGEYGIRVRTFTMFPTFTGHRIESNRIVNNRYGAISLRGCANNTIANNIIVNNTLFGIHLCHAGNNMIINNTVVNNGHGIDFYGNSNDNILRNNNMTDNEYNFGLILRGETRNFIVPPGIVNDVDTSNTVNGKPVYYLVNRSNEQVPSDAGYIWLNNCTNITISGCNLSHNLQGILLLFANNVSIIDNNITDNVYGIHVWIYSSNNTIIGNILEDNLNGVYLGDLSRFTTMRNNSINGGQMNFGVSPDIARHLKDASYLMNDIDTSNNVDGKPIIYWINQHDRQVPTNSGYVMLINSTNILIEDLSLSNNVRNIFLLASNNTVVANNSIVNSIYGIDVGDYGWFDYDTSINHRFYSFNTTIKRNVLADNGVGIRIRSDNSTISNSTLYRNPLGICLTGTSNSKISRNVVIASDMNVISPSPPPDLYIFYYPEWPWEYSAELARLEIGGIIVGGDYNVVYGNTVVNSYYSISMRDEIRGIMGYRNLIFSNNFINSTCYYPAIGWMRGNYWDNGYPAGGNYWSNYNGTDSSSGLYQNEMGSDGIGDATFLICPIEHYEVLDHYPLMAPISIFDAGTWNGTSCNIAIISNSTISNFQLNATRNAISFNVTGKTGLGFCRVTIPNVIVQDFWQGNYTVLVNGQPAESRNWTDEDNTYIYFTYQHSTQKVTIIPEFLSNIILAFLMTFSLIIFILAKRKFAKLRNSTDFEV